MSTHNSQKLYRIFVFITALVAIIGFIDALYLTAGYYRPAVLSCDFFQGCQAVAKSEYSAVFGIPIALFGSLFYLTFFSSLFLGFNARNKKRFFTFIFLMTLTGFLISMYLLYLQIYVITALCIYCLVSLATSAFLFIFGIVSLIRARNYN